MVTTMRPILGMTLGISLLGVSLSCGDGTATRSTQTPTKTQTPAVLVTQETGPSEQQKRLAATTPVAATTDTDIERKLQRAVDDYHRAMRTHRAHIAVDKPIYKPGETIWFRTFDLLSADLSGEKQAYRTLFQLISPKGAVVLEKRAKTVQGAAANDFILPDHVPGGEYIIKARTQQGTDVERAVIVSSYQPPRIKKKLEFVRKAYGPGDTVAGTIALERATGEKLSNHSITGLFTLDGVDIARVPVTTDVQGKAIVRHPLPLQITRGDGLLTILVQDGGVTESIQKRIPITLNTLNLAMFPEGGDLIQGLPGRIYFTAKNLIGKPADIEGRVLDADGRLVALFRSHYNGMGRFELTPKPGMRYRVEITKPIGIASTFDVPEARDTGCAMQAVDDIESDNDDIRIAVWCTSDRQLVASAVLRDNMLGTATFDTRAGVATVVSLPAPDTAQGAVRVTVFSDKLAPLTERLLFRNRKKDLNIEIETDRKTYNPRDRVTLTIRSRDLDGKPVPADMAVSVVDDTVISFADDKTAHLMTRIYLESEMPGQKIEEPNFYFSNDPKAAHGLDLVLGTHGWRRFDWKPVFSPPKPKPEPIVESWEFEGLEGRGERRKRAEEQEMLAKEAADNERGEVEEPARKLQIRQPIRANNVRAKQPAAKRVAAKNVDKAPRNRAVRANNNRKRRAPRAAARARRPAPTPPPANPVAAEPMPDMDEGRNLAGEELLILGDRAVNRRKRGFDVGSETAPKGITIRDKDWDDRKPRKPRVPFSPVRTFPMPNYAVRYDGPRVDFRETIFWQPRVNTDASGTAQLSFYLSDAVTSFKVIAQGTGQAADAMGLLGRGEALVQSKLPVSLAVKMPLEVSRGDTISLPITVANETDKPYSAKLETAFGNAFQLADNTPRAGAIDIALRANERKSFFYKLNVVGRGGNLADGKLRVAVEASNLRDQVERTVKVIPPGFPQEVSFAGTLKTRIRHELNLSDVIEGSMDAKLTLYPSPLATMVQGTQAIIREPTGCFEQASSANYPNIMVLDYLEQNDAADPELVKRTHGMLKRGYKKLTGYESPQRGYEWFGGNPGHEALTAYGLMEFQDMAKVYGDVDRAMIKRTATWLKQRRDGKGGYQRNDKALDSFGRASDDVTNGYITYALTEAGTKGIGKEITRQAHIANTTQDAYVLALAANTLLNHKADGNQANVAVRRVADMQAEDGSLPGANHSITRSGGIALTIESTALAALAFMKAGDEYRPNVLAAIEWLNKNRNGFGGYGSTQSTVLALKAMSTYAVYSRRTRSSGVVKVFIRGDQIAEKAYREGHQGALEFDLGPFVQPGQNIVDMTLESDEPIPYSMVTTYTSTVPASSPETKVTVSTRMTKTSVPMGESVRMNVRVANSTDNGIPMTLARIGIPGGLTFQTWQLKELRDKKLIDFYETREREVILYFRAMASRAVANVPLELKARVPGNYTAPASRAYLYYTDEYKHWVAPERISITR